MSLKSRRSLMALALQACISCLLLGAPFKDSIGADAMAGIKSRAEALVFAHPALLKKRYKLVWADFPISLPRCSRAVTDELLLTDKSDDEKVVTYKLTCDGEPRWTRVVRGRLVLEKKVLSALTDIAKGTQFSEALFQKPGGTDGNLDDSQKQAADLRPYAGRGAKRAIRAGEPLSLNDWERMTVINPGSRVQIQIRGSGYSVDADGEALDSGAVGDKVRVRLDSGNVVQGVVESANVVGYVRP